MDYEKKYKNALEWARQVMNGETGFIRKEVEEVFPELKESEDERIRKDIISYIQLANQFIPQFQKDKWLAWLEKQKKEEPSIADIVDEHYWEMLGDEKQGEQKPADKVEPKFRKGEWIVNNISQDIYLIKSINNGYYTLEDTKGNIISPCLPPCESESHLWSIKDAKDGDVLVTDEMIVLFKKRLENDSILTYFHYDTIDGECEPGAHLYYAHIYPATKEQRDTFFAKMKEAGYEWDAEKKELKIVDWSKHIKYEPNSPSITEEKSNWSEEDERMCQETIDWFEKKCFPYALESENPARESIKWLKSLKERYTWKPSEHELEVLRLVAEKDGTCLMGLYEHLKNLKEG